MPAGNFTSVNKIFYNLSKMFKNEKGHDCIAILQGKKDVKTLYGYLEGTLMEIEPFEDEYEGKKTFRIRFKFFDGTTEEWLECGRYTGFTRDVLNCMASLDSISQVRLTPFISEDENTGKKYVRGAVRVGPDFNKKENKVDKRFKGEDIPKMIPVEKDGKPVLSNGQQVFDDSELREWTNDLVAICQKKIKAVPPAAHTQVNAQVEAEDDNGVGF